MGGWYCDSGCAGLSMLTWHVPVGPAHWGALYGAEAYPKPWVTGPREPLRGPRGTEGLAGLVW